MEEAQTHAGLTQRPRDRGSSRRSPRTAPRSAGDQLSLSRKLFVVFLAGLLLIAAPLAWAGSAAGANGPDDAPQAVLVESQDDDDDDDQDDDDDTDTDTDDEEATGRRRQRHWHRQGARAATPPSRATT